MAIIGGVGFAVSRFFKFPIRTGPVTLTYWGLWEPEEVIRPLLDEFQTVHPNVKVEYQMQSPPEYRERLQSALSQGRGPDIFRIHNTWIPMLRSSLSPVPENIYTASDMETLFYPAVKSDLRVGSDYYAIPLEIDGLGLFVNNDLLQQAGLSVPQNWDDLRAAALAMSRCDSEDGKCTGEGRILISGAALGNTENVDHWQDILSVLMYQNNVNPGNPAANASAATDVLDYFKGFSSLYHIWDSSLPNSTTQFASGKAGFYFGPSWRVFDIKTLNPNLNFSVYPIPQLPVDPSRGEQPVTWAAYWVESVNAKSPNTQMAWELVKFLSSSDSLNKFYDQAVSSGRDFGEPFSRMELSGQAVSDPFIGPFISQAPLAKSWYLASFTHDGQSGINSRLSEAFSKALLGELDVNSLTTEINQILSGYGISTALPEQ